MLRIFTSVVAIAGAVIFLIGLLGGTTGLLSDPLPLHLAALGVAAIYAALVTDMAMLLVRKFWR